MKTRSWIPDILEFVIHIPFIRIEVRLMGYMHHRIGYQFLLVSLSLWRWSFVIDLGKSKKRKLENNNMEPIAGLNCVPVDRIKAGSTLPLDTSDIIPEMLI